MNLQLEGKTALISGSTAGIGFAIAAALAAEGTDVILNGRTQNAVDDAVARLGIPAKGKVLGFAGDLSDAKAAEALAKAHPDVDILVNNLGIFEPVAFENITDDEWRRFFDVNVLSGVRLSRLYLPGMRRRNWGRILFISSESGIHIPPEMIHYGMTKAAQIAVARGLAESVAGTPITVNSILPGPTRSRGVADFIDRLARERKTTPAQLEADFIKDVRPTSIIQRLATVEEVAALAVYIASPLASATTGAAMRVDGGVIRSAF